MLLHKNSDDFQSLITITADYKGIPEDAIKRDYYIVQILQKLEKSKYAESCVFKGGTSLSKCYPESIMRFSEDIDLTYLPSENLTNKQCNKELKNIEKILTEDLLLEKIPTERNDRNKSAYVFFDENHDSRIKLEIGSSVRPDPYSKLKLKTYIQEYLESIGMYEIISEYELTEVEINTLAIERTFLDKVMAVKRHAICGTLEKKVRHIYDVTCLLKRKDVFMFLNNKEELKKLVQKTKSTDSYYLEKRNISEKYNPTGKYDFVSWEDLFDNTIKNRYESLHKDLLYTSEKQNFEDAIDAFRKINDILSEIGE